MSRAGLKVFFQAAQELLVARPAAAEMPADGELDPRPR